MVSHTDIVRPIVPKEPLHSAKGGLRRGHGYCTVSGIVAFVGVGD